MLKFLLAQVRRFPWVTNVVWYSSIFTAGDLAQQKLLRKEKVDLKQTRNVALLAFSFHGNLFYMWLKVMEHVFPGTAPSNVLRKVVCDQLVVTPTGISGFYIGMSMMEGKQDIFAIWRETFWDTYKVAVIYWPTVQIVNYGLIPVVFRMAFFGCWGFVWVIFMSHLRQHRHGSANLIRNHKAK
ncbi:mpv17-like protein isoform X3 [Stegostoma tigrinum]|uniref:mpv17-like protein isoform X3 n=1 Tax=Stegostoma tigrinum TaxID=3053191 RepID=UPI00202AEEAC|nr:mpv17-like protein isoform X3 [Stegostoma tigrinum]XP_048408526.1 mpv17-like protein isoform X3 [Stegostoma tigrinum]XP_048408527.1 mpv17-like protein isoform X3 [Stegostoma tigrinum]